MKRNIQKGQGMKSGIYKIKNLVNDKYYIGSTKNLSSRYRTHLSTLKTNKSNCTILQNAVNKYGIENFEFSVLEICINYKEIEIEILNKEFPPYNCIKETLVKREISNETKEKISKALLKHYKNNIVDKTKCKGKKYNTEKSSIIELKSNLETLKYNSILECAKTFNCTVGALYNNFYRKTLFKHKYKVNIIKI